MSAPGALAEEMTVRSFSAAVQHDDPELYPSAGESGIPTAQVSGAG